MRPPRTCSSDMGTPPPFSYTLLPLKSISAHYDSLLPAALRRLPANSRALDEARRRQPTYAKRSRRILI